MCIRDSSGNGHGPDGEGVHLQTGEEGKTPVLPSQLHLVACGGFAHDVPHQKGHDGGCKNGGGEGGAGNQAGKAQTVSQGVRTGDPVALARLPGPAGQVGAEVNGNGIEHDGGDDLVHLQLDLQNAGNPGIKAPCGNGAQSGHGDGQPGGTAGEQDAKIGRNNGPQV